MGSPTNNLHRLIDHGTRSLIERDLVEQPPGRETYDKVYAAYPELAEKGISIKTIERHGMYLRKLARDRKIGRLADSIVGRELGDDIRGQIRARLYEAIVNDEASIGDLLKASITEANVTKASVTAEEWETKKAAMEKAIAESDRTAESDPVKARENLKADLHMIYGITG